MTTASHVDQCLAPFLSLDDNWIEFFRSCLVFRKLYITGSALLLVLVGPSSANGYNYIVISATRSYWITLMHATDLDVINISQYYVTF